MPHKHYPREKFPTIVDEVTKRKEELPHNAYEWSAETAVITGARIPLDRLAEWGKTLKENDPKGTNLTEAEIFNFQLEQIKRHIKDAVLRGENFEKWHKMYSLLVDKKIQKEVIKNNINLKAIYQSLSQK